MASSAIWLVPGFKLTAFWKTKPFSSWLPCPDPEKYNHPVLRQLKKENSSYLYVLSCLPTYSPLTNACKAWPRLVTRITGRMSGLIGKSWWLSSMLQLEHQSC